MYFSSDIYSKQDIHNNENNNNEITSKTFNEDELKKFYEERKLYYDDLLNNKKTNNLKNINEELKYKKKPLENFIYQKNNNRNKINHNDKKDNINEINRGNIKNNIKKDYILNNEIIEEEKDEELSKENYSSMTENNINKTSNLNSQIMFTEGDIFNRINEKYKVYSFYPKKNQNLKPEIIKNRKEQINLSPIKTNKNPNFKKIKNLSKSNIKEKYKNDLKKVLLERIEKQSPKNIKKLKLNIYERGKLYSQRSREKLKLLKQSINRKETEECSFSPNLSESNLFKSSSRNKSDFYNKNIEWKKKINKSLNNLLISIDKKTYEECSFRPKTNNILSLNNNKINKPDFVYKKNVIWMKKVNEKKKKLTLEKMEEIKLEIEKIQKENKLATNFLSEERKLMNPVESLRNLSKPNKKLNLNDNNNTNINHNSKNTFSEIQKLISSLKDTLEINKKINNELFNKPKNN